MFYISPLGDIEGILIAYTNRKWGTHSARKKRRLRGASFGSQGQELEEGGLHHSVFFRSPLHPLGGFWPPSHPFLRENFLAPIRYLMALLCPFSSSANSTCLQPNRLKGVAWGLFSPSSGHGYPFPATLGTGHSQMLLEAPKSHQAGSALARPSSLLRSLLPGVCLAPP